MQSLRVGPSASEKTETIRNSLLQLTKDTGQLVKKLTKKPVKIELGEHMLSV